MIIMISTNPGNRWWWVAPPISGWPYQIQTGIKIEISGTVHMFRLHLVKLKCDRTLRLGGMTSWELRLRIRRLECHRSHLVGHLRSPPQPL